MCLSAKTSRYKMLEKQNQAQTNLYQVGVLQNFTKSQNGVISYRDATD